VTLTFSRSTTGRKVSGRCVPATKHDAKKHRCTRSLAAGALTLSGQTGVNHVAFGGRISGRVKLKPDRYSVAIAATAGGKSSAPHTLSFTIVAPAAAAAAALSGDAAETPAALMARRLTGLR
jgi:hypothetical protein